MAYSEKANCYLVAIAKGVFSEQSIRDWIVQGTPHEAFYLGASVLIEEQRKVRGNTKQPFYVNYWCGKGSNCTCSKSLESDAVFFFRNHINRVIAVHVEIKLEGEEFRYGQAEGYPLRAACFARTHGERETVNAHHDWTTVLFCGENTNSSDRQHFHRAIKHSEARQRLADYHYPPSA